MKTLPNKSMTIFMTLILLSSIATTIITLPTAEAHSPKWEIPTYAYLSVAPNPIGVGQRLFIVMWLDSVLPGAAVENTIRYHNFKLTITKPDNTVETKEWPLITDTAASQPFLYYPDKVGNYTFKWAYLGETYTWNTANTPGLSAANALYENDTFLPCESKLVTVNVQEQPVYSPPSSYPMPTEYWTRPIEGENSDWWTISSNWLGRQSPQLAEERLRNPEDGVGPVTSHVMWTKPIQEGGVVGGTNNFVEGEGYYIGTTYNRRFNNPIVMYGVLYYTEPESIEVTTNTAGGLTKAVDLRTGQELWSQRIPGPNNLFQFGYVYTSGDNPNMHGTWPGILFTADFGRAFDARTGNPLFNVTFMPVTRSISPTTSVGTEALGEDGAIYLYQINAANKWIAQWNSSKLWTWGTTPTIQKEVIGNIPITPARPTTSAGTGQAWNWNGSAWVAVPSAQATQIATRYDWNITVPELQSNAAIIYTLLDDMMLIRNGTLPTPRVHDPYTVYAINLNASRGQRGQVLWMKNYDPPAVSRSFPGKLIDTVNNVFIGYDKEVSQLVGFSLVNGEQLWTTTLPADSSDFILYSYLGAIGMQTAYGLVYFGGYGGIMHAYDTKTGELVWTYGNGGAGNTTYSGTGLAYGRYPIYPGPIAEGVLYLDTGEHSAQPPLYKDSLVRALNATTGQEIWTLTGWGGHHRREGFAVADGFLVYLNHYDMQIYSIGKGPSAITVEAPKAAVDVGRSLVISGMVTDIAAGTKQNEQAARFPFGVPAVSDESMSDWMRYVYMQKPRPTNVTGVPVEINVVDSNGNYRQIGTVTSNSDGFYTLNWKPDIEGQYTVYASFGGSAAYWPSHAITSFAVDPALPTPAPTQSPPQSAADLYLLPGIIAIIVAILLVGVVLALLVVKKRP
jgi:hypothetical protein